MANEENLISGLLGLSQDDVNNQINAISMKATGRPATAEMKVVAKKTAERQLKKVFVDRNLTKGQRFIMANLQKLTEEVRKRINQGTQRFKDADYYVRTQVIGGGEQNLITDALTKLPGVSNLSKGRLPDYSNVAVTRVEINYDVDTTGAITAKTADYRPISSSNTDSAAENGELVITLDGTEVFRQPVNQFNKQEENVLSPANGFNLKAPFLITENQVINIRLVMSDGCSLATAGSKTHFFDVHLKGDEVGQK
jgi:hypothetical protein